MDEQTPTQPDRVPYYYVGERRVKLYPDPHVFGLRLDETAHLKSEAVSRAVRELIADAEPVAFLVCDRLNVYRSDAASKIVAALRRAAGVALAAPAFTRMPEGGDSIFVTPRLLAQFRPNLTPEQIATSMEKLGLRIVEPLAYAAPTGFLLEAMPGECGLEALRAANTLVEEGLVVFAEPDLVQARHFRAGPPDPAAAVFVAQQWHLDAAAVRRAWADTQGDPAIRIAVMDDGLDTGHPEFSVPTAAGAPRVAAQYDFGTNTQDASPKTYLDNHGTACSGVAAAAGVQASGAAPGCRLIGIRIPDFLGASDEARMFQWVADNGADVISCSWGPVDGLGQVDPLPTATRLAIQYCLSNGRAGKGIPIFWAAGNGSELVSNDGYASNPNVMAIAACTADGARAPYSDFGPEIFACAPSNGKLGDPAIFTTDRSGVGGYNPGMPLHGDAKGDYTNSFGGTSAAASLAAGIAALALSVNPDLTAAQLRDLLRETADRIGDASAYDASGHSDQLGYGRLNAAQAVATARAGATAGAASPAIIGPAVWSRAGSPPAFQVAPLPHAYYVVEVAAVPSLFDVVTHGAERTPFNFYGSWSDSPFQTARTYTLPAAAWAKLRVASRLWYRVGASASSTAYVDYVVSTPDDLVEQASSLEIVAGVGAPPPRAMPGRRTISDLIDHRLADMNVLLESSHLPPDAGDAWIEGPLRWDRRLGPPIFRVELAPGASYVMEVGTNADCFHQPQSPEGMGYFRSERINRTDSGWHAYTLPAAAWQDLLGSRQLYYRLVGPGREAIGPVLSLDLAGPVRLQVSDAEVPVRADELLWREAQLKPSDRQSPKTRSVEIVLR